MKILILNWQDRENPQAGGAELHLHQIFGRLVRRGHSVDLLCSGWNDAAPRATIDGINVHRVGSRHTYPFLAHRYYRRNLASLNHDVVIEDLNKAPLYTPLWKINRLVALVHHLFGSTAFRETAAPLAAALWLAERPIRSLYRKVAFEAVSESTANDLVRRGIPRDHIRVVYNGVDTDYLTPDPSLRSPTPLFIYIGRLKRYKGVDLVIRSFAQLKNEKAALEIAGTGDYRPALEALTREVGIESRVRFLGFIPEESKLALLRRAWAATLASPKEGWGISNMEAAACGTPVVASDSPGIRESVIDGETGFLVPHGDVAAMADAMRRLAESPSLVESMGKAGRRFAEGFSWEKSADGTIAHLEEVVMRRGDPQLWK
ncbi:MAG: glycosyltransferase family 4 protein [Gemmatimonadaceae bacterium]